MASDADSSMWKSYIAAVKAWCGGGAEAFDSNSRVIFVASTQQRGIAAGRGIPIAATNFDLYQKADSLLNGKSVWYNPASAASYVVELKNYLEHVESQGQKNAATQQALDNALAASKKATADFKVARDAALADYTADLTPGKAPFQAWIMTFAPDYIESVTNLANKTAQVAQARIKRDGPGAATLNNSMQRVSEALTGATGNFIEGVTMPGKIMQTRDVQAYIEQLRSGNSMTVEEPKEVAYYPAYHIDTGYRDLMDQWNLDFDNNPYGAEIEISVARGKDFRLEEAGHDSKEVEASLLWGWFTYKANSQEEYKKLITEGESTNVTVKMQAKKTALIGVGPNSVPAGWNIPDYRRLYPHTRPDLPASAKNVVQPSQMLCASGVRMSVRFAGSTKKSFEEKLDKGSRSGGRFSVFGIQISADLGPKADTTDTHTGSYDEPTGTLTIEPTKTVGTCTLLAMIGQKVF